MKQRASGVSACVCACLHVRVRLFCVVAQLSACVSACVWLCMLRCACLCVILCAGFISECSSCHLKKN